MTFWPPEILAAHHAIRLPRTAIHEAPPKTYYIEAMAYADDIPGAPVAMAFGYVREGNMLSHWFGTLPGEERYWQPIVERLRALRRDEDQCKDARDTALEGIRASSWMSDDGKVWHRGTTTGTACGAEVEGEMGGSYDMAPKDRLCPACLKAT